MNKTGSAAKVKLNSFDDLFGDGQPQAGIEQVQEIALSELHEFKGHPFKVLDDEKMLGPLTPHTRPLLLWFGPSYACQGAAVRLCRAEECGTL